MVSKASSATASSSSVVKFPLPGAGPGPRPNTVITKPTTSTPSPVTIQQLSVNHLQVPQPHTSVINSLPVAGTVATNATKPSLMFSGTRGSTPATACTSTSQQQSQPSFSINATAQRVSDLRNILNPEVEKEDSFKKLSETIENCECFEFNLNNAAKLITVVVLLATFILVIKALKGDR